MRDLVILSDSAAKVDHGHQREYICLQKRYEHVQAHEYDRESQESKTKEHKRDLFAGEHVGE